MFAIIFTQNDQKLVKIDVFLCARGLVEHVSRAQNAASWSYFLGGFGSEMCLVAWWMWPGQLPVLGSNGALPNTLQNLQNSKNQNP